MRVENLTLDPTCGTSSKGRLIFNTTSGLFKVCDGTSYVSVAGTGVNNLQSVLTAGNTAGRDMDMNGYQILNSRVENRSSDPTPSSVGRLFYNTTSGALKLDTGSSITAIGGSQSLSSVLSVGNGAGASNIDFNGNQALNMRLENLASDPGTTTTGRVYFSTATSKPRFYNGSSWLDLGNTNTLAQTMLLGNSVGSTDLDLNSRQAKNMRLHNIAAPPGTGTAGMIWYDTVSNQIQYETTGTNKTVATLDDTQTLSNKTISGASNTITNIPDSSLSSNVMLNNGNETITGTKTFLASPVVNSIKTPSGAVHTLTDGLANDTFTLNNAVQELKGKTLNSPTLSGKIDFNGYEGVKLRAENLTSNPSPGLSGRIFYKSSTGELLFDDGTKWNALSFGTSVVPTFSAVLASGNSAGANNINVNNNQLISARVENVSGLPAFGNPGRVVFNTNTNVFYIDTGTAWGAVSTASTPVVISGNYTVLPTDRYILQGAAGATTITLPDATTNSGMTLMVKNTGTGSPTITPTGGQTIDGQSTLTINVQYASVNLIAVSGAWYLW